MTVSSTSAAAIPARFTASPIAAAPSSGAVRPDSSPWKPPIGVRTPERMTISFADMARTSLARRCTRQPLLYHQNKMCGLVSRLLEQLAADQPAADFRRACADLVKLGIAQKPTGRIVVDVTVAAEALHRLKRHPGALFRSVEDRAGRILARGLAAVAGARHRIDVGARRRQRDIHIGEFALHELEGADRLAELTPLMDVWNDDIETGLHDTK